MCGVASENIQRKLLQERDDLTSSKACSIDQVIQTTNADVQALSRGEDHVTHVKVVVTHAQLLGKREK